MVEVRKRTKENKERERREKVGGEPFEFCHWPGREEILEWF
jgi:hypothetical protein